MSVFFKDKKSKSGKILIAGGIGSNDQVLKSCELLDCQTGSCTKVLDTNFATCNGTLVSFNDQIILKIGGLSKSKRDYSVVEIIQKLDLNASVLKWQYIELEDVKKGHLLQYHTLFFANQGAIQINPNEIFVFGGFGQGQKGSNDSYIIEIEKFKIFSRSQGEEVDSYRFYARWYNQKPLISGDDFKELKPVVWGSKLYSLQNISGERNKTILDKQKRLIQFNMYQWYETQNIVIE